ncbi:MAG: NBR1-Ig-like domain-containing protein, partial [Anaerolineales bacterium]
MKPSRLLVFLLVFVLLFAAWPVSPAQAATICDWAQFIADVTIPDGTVMAPGTAFTKTWRLKNIGTCTWGSGYRLAFSSGSQMDAPAEVNLPYSVAPGQMVDVSVTMTAPSTPGTYRGYWLLKNA